MSANKAIAEIQAALQRFQDGYAVRDFEKLDEFMTLFVPSAEIEMIGIGAAVRGGQEWFQGFEQVRDIIEGDWKFWGDVLFNLEDVKITVHHDVAWLSAFGSIGQSEHFDEAIGFFLTQMQEMLADESQDVDTRFMEATHYGMRRVRERSKPIGYKWPFTFTAVLIHNSDNWQFHTIHWSMPVD
jgi:hypothetical protein